MSTGPDGLELLTDFWTINTFVFLDLETTGLIKEYEPLPKITELAFVAVSRNNFLNCRNGMPRIMHKLTLPINPNVEIPTIVQNMTKITQESLKSERDFDEDVYTIIKHFINRLTEPICVISHNGNTFDFPLLLNELQTVKQDFLNDLPQNLLCLDTLEGFKNIIKNSRKDVDRILSSQSLCRLPNDHTYPKTCYSPNVNVENGKNKSVNSYSPKRLENYKLPTIFKHLHGCPASQEHSAEDDCITLLKCCLKVKDQFIYWADLNASPLKNYQIKHATLRSCY